MPLVVLKDTVFSSFGNTSAVGSGQTLVDGWVDIAGSLYSINSGVIGGQSLLSSSTSGTTYYKSQQLAQPSSLSSLDQQINLTIGLDFMMSTTAACELRWDGNQTAYVCLINLTNGTLTINTMVGGSLMTIGTASPFSYGSFTPHSLLLQFSASGSSPTTLAATLTDTTNSASVTSIAPFTDNTSGLQSTGRYAIALQSNNGVVQEVSLLGDGNSISVTDGVTLGDTPTISTVVQIQPNVSDNLTVGDTPNLLPIVLPGISVSDGITLADVPATPQLSFLISETDALTLADSTAQIRSSFITKVDGVTLTDSSTTTLSFAFSVTDGLTVGETVSVKQQTANTIVVQDNVVLGEAVVVAPPTIPSIAVSDGLTLGESLNVNRIYLMNVTDGLTLTDTVNVSYVPLVTAIDGLTLADSVTITPLLLQGINVTSGITVGDLASVGTPFNNNFAVADGLLLNDGAFVSYNLSLSITDGLSIGDNCNVFDAFTITSTEGLILADTIAVTPLLLNHLVISEGLLVADTWQVNVNTTSLSVTDGITLTDHPSPNFLYTTNVTDGLTLGDTVVPSAPLFVVEPPNAEGVMLGEGLSVTIMQLPTRIISVTDGMVVGESYLTARNFDVSITENIAVGETVFQHPHIFYQLVMADSVSAEDGMVWDNDLNNWDLDSNNWEQQLGVVDPQVTVYYVVTKNDGLTVNDVVVNAGVIYCITLGEIPLGVGDTLSNITKQYYLGATDGITLGEAIRNNLIFLIIGVESTIIGDSLAIALTSYASVLDNLALSDIAGVTKTYNAGVSDGLTVFETLNVTRILMMAIQDSLLVMESLQESLTSTVALRDGLILGDTAGVRGIATQGPLEVTAGQITSN